MKGKEIPKLEEIIKCNERHLHVNWRKFYHLQRLASNSHPKMKRKARLYLGYYLCILTRRNILETLPSDTYIILLNQSKKPSGKDIKNPSHNKIKYGFYREEDAEKYAQMASPESFDNLVIDKYYEVFPVDETLL